MATNCKLETNSSFKENLRDENTLKRRRDSAASSSDSSSPSQPEQTPQIKKSKPSPSFELLDSSVQGSQILKGMYVGSSQDALIASNKNPNNIKKVVAVANHTFSEIVKNKFRENMLNLNVESLGWRDLIKVEPQAFDFIDQALEDEQSVLIHCANGQCRSVGFIIAYLIYKGKISFEKAFEYVSQKHPKTDLSDSISDGLKNYASSLLNKN